MSNSRRVFLHKSALAAAGLSLKPWSVAEGRGMSRISDTPRGLLFDKSEIPRMLKTIKLPRFAPYWKSIVDADLAADTKFLREELRLNNHVADFLKARIILERTSFVFALTQDAKQLEVAKLAVRRILDYAKWDYFLEGGTLTFGLQRAPEATIAMAFALEWLDAALTDREKAEIKKQIGEKGALACYRTLWGMKHPDRVRGWGFDPDDDYKFRFDLSRWPFILNSTNLKVIPIAGLGIAGCLLHGEHPQAERWTELALQSAKAFAPMFGSDGSYEEGVSYWGYTALHLALFLEVLYRKRGIDERSLINFPGTARHGLQMSMPTIDKPADCVNFGDASVVGDTSVVAWVARTKRDGIAQYVATEVGDVRNNYGIIWFDDSVASTTPGPEYYDVRFANDWVVSRTGWDTQSSVVALRSGFPANHEHADRNSVVFKAFGERLLHDPFKAAYSYTQQHWILRLTAAHTAVLIDGKGHQYHDGHEGTNASWAEAKIIDYNADRKRMVVTSDATDAYKLVQPSVDLVQRTLVFVKPDILVFLDRIRLSSPAKAQVRFQIYNEDNKGKGEVSDSGFTIQRPNASLQASVRGTNKVSFRSGQHNVPADIGIYPYVEVESEQDMSHEIMTVCIASGPKKEQSEVAITKKENTWTAAGKHAGKKFKVSVSVGGEKPVVEIDSPG